MKNKRIILGMVVMKLMFGMVFMGCDNGSTQDDALTGTWTGYNEDAGGEMKLVASGGSFTVYVDDQPAYKGTYTTSGNDVTMTFTHMNTGLMSGGTTEWTPYDDVPEGTDGLPSKTMQGTISGGELSVEGMTFTKQGGQGGQPGGGGQPGDALTGTWISGTLPSPDMKIVAQNGSWSVYFYMYDMGGAPEPSGEEEAFRGTYTISGNAVTFTITQIYMEDRWVSYAEVLEGMGDDVPDEFPPATITGTISNGQITLMGDTFTKQSSPGPGPGPQPGEGGTFTLTGIPSKYNGSYACLRDAAKANIYGAQSVAPSDQTNPVTPTCVKITGDTLELPMWAVSNNNQITRYTATVNVTVTLVITSRTTIDEHIDENSDGIYATVTFNDVGFSGGSASKAWSEGTVAEKSDPPGTGGGDSDVDITGTWIGTVEEMELTLVIEESGKWTASMQIDDKTVDVYRGTSTVTGKAISFTFSDINTGILSGGTEQWTAYDQLTDDQKENLPNENPTPGTVDGETLTFGEGDNSQTFTKQP
jgi:hypothetical protein